MRDLLERYRLPVIAASVLVLLLALSFALRGTGAQKQAAGRGDVAALAHGISEAIRAAGPQASSLPQGPLSDRLWASLRQYNPQLPPLESLGRLVDIVQAGTGQGELAGKGFSVLLQGRLWGKGFLAATADGVYECSGWWTGCVKLE
jgi:hypothetical protein